MVNIKAAIEMVMHFLVLAFMSAPLFNELFIVVDGSITTCRTLSSICSTVSSNGWVPCFSTAC
jgi:hypothetical protein